MLVIIILLAIIVLAILFPAGINPAAPWVIVALMLISALLLWIGISAGISGGGFHAKCDTLGRPDLPRNDRIFPPSPPLFDPATRFGAGRPGAFCSFAAVDLGCFAVGFERPLHLPAGVDLSL